MFPLYGLVVTVIVFALLVIIWRYLAPIVGSPWDKIGWAIIGAAVVLWLLRLLLFPDPLLTRPTVVGSLDTVEQGTLVSP
jgi:hypothetical protein